VTASINRQALADFGLRPASEDSWSIDRWLDEIRSAGFQVLSSAELAPPDRIDHLQARLRRYLWSIRALRSTAQRAAERDYRRRLNAQRWPEAAIEARLFVLVKPA
jgi:hypothetical protein